MRKKDRRKQFFMKKELLAVKLLVAQLLTFMIIYVAVLTTTPNIVYHLTNKGEVQTAMSFNEQIAMRIEQRFSELERFSSVVASDDGLNELLQEAMSSNDYAYQALLHLYLSNIIQRDGVSTYHVLGMYLELDGEKTFATNTVGLSDNLKAYIKDKVLPEYESYGNSEMFVRLYSAIVLLKVMVMSGLTVKWPYGKTCYYLIL